MQPQALTALNIHQPNWTSEFCIPLSQTAAPSEAGDNPLDYWYCEEIVVQFHNNPQQQFNHRFPLKRTAVEGALSLPEKAKKTLKRRYTHAHYSPGVPQQLHCFSFFPFVLESKPSCPASAVLLYTPQPLAHVVRGWWRGKGARGSGRTEKTRQGGRAGESQRKGHSMTG